jgi:hypothetical protein
MWRRLLDRHDQLAQQMIEQHRGSHELEGLPGRWDLFAASV